MENHSDTESTVMSTQILGDRDFPSPYPPPLAPATVEVTRKGRVLPPWAHPSYEWGGGKWKEDGRKNKKKKESDLSSHSLEEDLMNEYSSLRFLESLFDPTTNIDDDSVVGPRIEFDFSLSSTHVLNDIRKHIKVSELRPGMPELSKFNLLPFIAHKNMSLPLCALEKLRDVIAMENNLTAPPAVVPVYFRDDDHQPEQQEARTGLEQTNKDKVVVIDDTDDEVQTRVIVIDGNDTSAEQQPVDNNCNTSRETTSSPSSGARVKCIKDGAWLICGSDDESGTDLVKNIPPRPESDLCWKCQRQGGDSLLLLTCSRSECGTKVHKECLNGEVQFDEHGKFLCPVCWFDRMATEYHECQELLRCAKRKLVKFLPLLCRASKRLIDDDGRSC